MRYFTNICIVTTVHFYDNNDRIEIRKWTHKYKKTFSCRKKRKNTAADFRADYRTCTQY